MAKKTKALEIVPRVIKRASCKSLSQKSELIYVLAIDQDEDIVIRILGNDGGGFHSNEPIKVSKILEALGTTDTDESFSSSVIGHLFQGQSSNNRSFLMAVLSAEKVVAPVEGQRRKFKMADIEGFLDQAKALQTGKAAPKATPTKKSPAVKAKAAPSPAKGRKKSS